MRRVLSRLLFLLRALTHLVIKTTKDFRVKRTTPLHLHIAIRGAQHARASDDRWWWRPAIHS
jgi:hypothetical protein